MNVPIVFVHRGNQEFLQYSILQSAKSNPKSKIYLLGDESNQSFSDLAENVVWKNCSDYEDNRIEEFAKNYKHMSTNPAQFEFLCFYRWFVLNNFLSTIKQEYIFYADSDVLVFDDVTQKERFYKDYRLTLSHRYCPNSMYIKNDGILGEYLSLVEGIYGGDNPIGFEKCKDHYERLQRFNKPGGVCDMTLWEIFNVKNENPGFIGEMSSVFDDETFDHNINASDGYQMQTEGPLKIKKIAIEDNNLYGFLKSGRKVKFLSLHFQGNAKFLMQNIYKSLK